MKIILLVGLLLPAIFGYSQAATWPPLILLDSVAIDLKQHAFDPEKIDSIHIDNKFLDTSNHFRGRIFITSKQPRQFSFLTIAAITTQYAKGNQQPIIYMLDNEFLTDISTFTIDAAYILKVQLISAADLPYLKGSLTQVCILKIITRSKENLDKARQIHIRGSVPVAAR